MANSSIDCLGASQLIAEVSATGCRSPWEMDLLELALLNRILQSSGDGISEFPLTADMTAITADMTRITADQTEYYILLTVDVTTITADSTTTTADRISIY